MKIYVGNLSQQTTDDDLLEAFGTFGNVLSASIIRDKFSGASKGFGFVEMGEKAEAQAAMQELNGSELNGTRIIVNEARPKSDKRKGGKNPGKKRRW